MTLSPSTLFRGRAAVVLAIFLLALVWIIPYRRTAILNIQDQLFHLRKPPAPKGTALAPGRNTTDDDRPLVLYAYAESPNARTNLEFFIAKGLHGAADFVFIFNGDTTAADLIPQDLPNVRVVHRPNTCYDLGAYGEVLTKDDLWKKYKRFITMNASIRGPFFPVYSPGCWSDMFMGRLTDTVKLAGISINCNPSPHIQSMLLATDHVGMDILLKPELSKMLHHDDGWGGPDDPVGFSGCYNEFRKAVHAEIGTTELIRAHGYEAEVMMTAFHGAGPNATLSTYCEDNGNPGDVQYDGTYFGSSLHPYETIFFKANRGIAQKTLDNLSKWHKAMEWTSWDSCHRSDQGAGTPPPPPPKGPLPEDSE